MKRVITIDCCICESVATSFITQLRTFNEQSTEPVMVFISSYGGSCSHMLGMKQAIDNATCEVIMVAVGTVMSAGAFLTMSGEKGKRLAARNTQFMFHNPLSMIDTTSEDDWKMLDSIANIQKELIMEEAGMSLSEVEDLLERDKYLWPDEVRDLGLIDGILGSTQY